MLNKGKDELGAEPQPCNGEMKPRHLVLPETGKEKKDLMFSSLKCSLCRTAQQPQSAADQDSSQAGNIWAMSARQCHLSVPKATPRLVPVDHPSCCWLPLQCKGQLHALGACFRPWRGPDFLQSLHNTCKSVPALINSNYMM